MHGIILAPLSKQPRAIPSISDGVRTFLDLLATHLHFESVWLFGSRANDTFRHDSDWDFLVFGTPGVLTSLRANDIFRRPDIHLFIVTDGNRLECPWPRADTIDNFECGQLKSAFDFAAKLFMYGWRWKQVSATHAIYWGGKDPDGLIELQAYRIFPSSQAEPLEIGDKKAE